MNDQNKKSGPKRPLPNLSAEESKIVEILETENLHFDELAVKSGLAPKRLGETLSLLELKGLIKNLNNSYSLTSF